MRNSMIMRWSLSAWLFFNIILGVEVDELIQVVIVGILAITYAIDENGESK